MILNLKLKMSDLSKTISHKALRFDWCRYAGVTRWRHYKQWCIDPSWRYFVQSGFGEQQD